MTAFQIIAIILTLTAMGGYLNQKFMRFPATIGFLAFALVISLIVTTCGELGLVNIRTLSRLVSQIQFSHVLLHGMLSFLLFAGALHINIDELKSVGRQVGVLATFGVLIATFITGSLVWWGASLVHIELSYIDALLFGALISPTDPIAVLSILKKSNISRRLYMKIGGESLFNDGIGVVAFITILGLSDGDVAIDFSHISLVLVRETLGGIALGLGLGWLTYRLLRTIDAYRTEVLLTLALVTGGYALAEYLHVSAPIFMVVAGLVVGNHGRNFGMSEKSRERIDAFWELLDDILNAILFMLIGLEIIIITITLQHILLGLLAIAAVLVGRVISVGVPTFLMRLPRKFDWRTVSLLTWGGLRGGLSIALALSLPNDETKDILLPITYIVVLFSILVQGLSFKPALKFLVHGQQK